MCHWSEAVFGRTQPVPAWFDRPEKGSMDPLSDVLSLLKPRSYSCGGTDAAGDEGMSRSIQKFKDTVGEPPMEYLVRWRMTLAGDKLVNSSDPISVIALSLGYESESAFGKSFKRVTGCSPRQYDRGRAPSSPSRTNDALFISVGLVEC
jgi:Helix-turn-helix domain